MLRKALITVTALSALCVGSAAMAAHGGGGGGGGGGHGGGGGGFGGGAAFGGGGSFGHGGSFGGASLAATPRGAAGPMMMQGGNMGPTRGGPMTAAPMTRGPMTTGPITRGSVQGWNGQWANNHFHDHFHNRFRNRNFVAFGFGGPIYDYAYDSCWTQVPTYYGWQWVNVCGDYYGY